MRKNFITGILLTIFSFGFSQNYFTSENIKTEKYDAEGKLKFVTFTQNSNIPEAYAEKLLLEAFDLTETNLFVKTKEETDIFGANHIHFAQFYNGVEVEFSRYSVHAKNGVITSINGAFKEIDVSENLSQIKSTGEIYQIGLGYLGSSYSDVPEEFLGKTPKGILRVLTADKSITGTDRYAYVFPMISAHDENVEKVYLDAVTGQVLYKRSILFKHETKIGNLTKEQLEYLGNLSSKNEKTVNFSHYTLDAGNADTRYSGPREIETTLTDDGYILLDEDRHVQTKNFGDDYLSIMFHLIFGGDMEGLLDLAADFVDEDNNWTEAEYSATKDDGALEAHWAFSEIYDFFKDEYDRDGFDDENSFVTSFIHTEFFGDGRNAAWMTLSDLDPDYSGGLMLIGDGDYDPDTGAGMFDILASLDVVAHEYSHGVTGAASGLVYERESGALNEGFADIWGATIEADRAPDKERWMMGEDFVMVAPHGIRSFDNPKLFGQPDTYMGINWEDASEDCIPGSDNDNCGVHTNSGVLNHWYYLLVEGGEGTNDNDFEYSVEGIGIEKAADLVYSVQLSYVQYESNFEDVRDYTLQEAVVMFGEDSDEAAAVNDAWCAVGVTTGEACGEDMSLNDMSISSFSIYPNPATDILNILASKVDKLNYTVHGTSGQLLMNGEVNNGKININMLPKGVYILTLKGANEVKTFKFIKK